MKNTIPFKWVATGLAAGLALGFAIGKPIWSGNHKSAAPRAESMTKLAGSSASTVTAIADLDRHQFDSLADRLRQIISYESQARRDFESEVLFASLGLESVSAAQSLISGLLPGPNRMRLLGRLFHRWGELDGPGALEAAASLPPAERRRAQSAALEGWSGRDVISAWQAASDTILDEPAHAWIALPALRRLAKENLPMAIAESTGLPSYMNRNSARNAIIDDALETGSIAHLIEEAQLIGVAATRESWISEIFRRWGSVDANASLAALDSVSDPSLARGALAGVLSGWGQQDPVAAVGYTLEHRADPLFSGILNSVVQAAVGASGRAEVQSILDHLHAANALDSVSGILTLPLGQSYPDLALEMIAKLSDEPQKAARIASVFTHWATNDFPAAATHYDQMEEGLLKTTAFMNLASRAFRHDGGAERVVGWIEDFPETERGRVLSILLARLDLDGGARLTPQTAENFARLVASTPDLPEDARQRANRLFRSDLVP